MIVPPKFGKCVELIDDLQGRAREQFRPIVTETKLRRIHTGCIACRDRNGGSHVSEWDHWQKVYEDKAPEAVSWYQAEPAPSLAALERIGADPSLSLIDIGGGASSLVDALLDGGWRDITVVDIAASALAAARVRLGVRADQVRWLTADITAWTPDRAYDIWHDRAVFHFLAAERDRTAYRRALEAGTRPGGHVVIATFAPDGPEMCSGLPVMRYDAKALAAELGGDFALLDHWREAHVTPWGASQSFQWCVFRRES